MGRSSKSAAAQAGVGDERARLPQSVPRIFHVCNEPRGDWEQRLERAAKLGFDHICINPFATRRNDPLLIEDLGGASEEAVRKIASSCKALGLRLCIDIVLDRLAADGASARQAGDL